MKYYSPYNAFWASIKDLDENDCVVITSNREFINYRYNHDYQEAEFEFPSGDVFRCSLGAFCHGVTTMMFRIYDYSIVASSGGECSTPVNYEETFIVLKTIINNKIMTLLDKLMKKDHQIWIWEMFILICIDYDKTEIIDMIPADYITNIIMNWSFPELNVYLIESMRKRDVDPSDKFKL